MSLEKCIVLCQYNHNCSNEDDSDCGDITSVAVLRNYRRLGIAQRLMRQVEKKMIEVYNIKYCRLNVRETNYAARHLYSDVLGFKLFLNVLFICRQIDVDVKYYADGENGIRMEQDLVALRKELGLSDFKGEEMNNDSSEKTAEPGTKKKSKSKKNQLYCPFNYPFYMCLFLMGVFELYLN